METPETKPCALTIAGSDSGGNAGVQADLRAFHAFGIHGCTVFAALTAQNPSGVSAVHEVPADFVRAQMDAVFGAYSIRALKTGMLPSAEAVEAVAERLAGRGGIAKVVDPVMIATSGARLMRDGAADAMRSRLLPLADVVTPNIPEAEALSGRAISTFEDACEAAKALAGEFSCAVIIKGGHASGGATCDDVMWDGRELTILSAPRIANPVSTHGTGCSFAAALAAGLALGFDLGKAARRAKTYVYNAIRLSYYVGARCGVLGMAPAE